VPIYLRRPRHRCKSGSRRGVVHAAVRRQITILQRERTPTLNGVVAIGDSFVLFCTLVLHRRLSWGTGRINRGVGQRGRTPADGSGVMGGAISRSSPITLRLAITRVRARHRRRRCGTYVAWGPPSHERCASHENSDSPGQNDFTVTIQDS